MIEKDTLKKIKPGARVRVYEGTTPFEGLVLARKHGNEAGATFTVRTTVAGVGLEDHLRFAAEPVEDRRRQL